VIRLDTRRAMNEWDGQYKSCF